MSDEQQKGNAAAPEQANCAVAAGSPKPIQTAHEIMQDVRALNAIGGYLYSFDTCVRFLEEWVKKSMEANNQGLTSRAQPEDCQ
jgi:hypothetical protein